MGLYEYEFTIPHFALFFRSYSVTRSRCLRDQSPSLDRSDSIDALAIDSFEYRYILTRWILLLPATMPHSLDETPSQGLLPALWAL